MKKILLLDNYDSFTYNLVHLVNKVDERVVVDVVRNDKIELNSIDSYDRIILSPGPGIPEEAGLLLDVVRTYRGKKPILGVCLGQQAIAVADGSKLINLDKVFHGVATEMFVQGESSILFNGIHSPFPAGRYHSWVIDESTISKEFEITARDNDRNIMAIECRADRIYGLQFHPESIMTECGELIMKNFLSS